VDRGELSPSARFFDDLGGESIDMLDLQFRCEKRFGRRIEIQRMLGETVEVDDAGHIKPATLATLAERSPYLAADRLGANSRLEHLKELITVEAITRLVQEGLMSAVNIPARTLTPGEQK